MCFARGRSAKECVGPRLLQIIIILYEPKEFCKQRLSLYRLHHYVLVSLERKPRKARQCMLVIIDAVGKAEEFL